MQQFSNRWRRRPVHWVSKSHRKHLLLKLLGKTLRQISHNHSAVTVRHNGHPIGTVVSGDKSVPDQFAVCNGCFAAADCLTVSSVVVGVGDQDVVTEGFGLSNVRQLSAMIERMVDDEAKTEATINMKY